MNTFKKPDLNAPRFRPRRINVLNKKFCSELKNKHPQLKKYTDDQIKNMVKSFNGKIWKTVVDYRDGVELPEQLGRLFIGTCGRRKKRYNPDFATSAEYGVKVRHRNWESDEHIAKIFYTNFQSKYTFRFHELWGFKAVRDFSRHVAHTYPIEWKKYVVVDNLVRVSKLFRKHLHRDMMRKKTSIDLKSYDEFDMDD